MKKKKVNDNDNFQMGICFEGKNYSDGMTTIINNTTHQLSEILAKNNLNITINALAVQRKSMPVEEKYEWILLYLFPIKDRQAWISLIK